MRKLRITIILLFALTVIAFLGYFGTKPKVFPSETLIAGVVTVEAVPKELKPGQRMIFTLKLNNHSMSLDYDYTKMAVVVDNDGNIYKPVEWTGGVGGHHISGDLVFGKLSEGARHIGLNIKGIDSKDLPFDWNIN